MKIRLIAVAAIGCAGLALVPFAEARGIRTDLPCPFGGGLGAWTGVTPANSPFNPGAPTSYSAQLTMGAGDNFESPTLTTTSATMYAWYARAIPTAGCAPQPVEQVIDYKIAPGNSLLTINSSVLLPVGATEVEFNYGDISGAGIASFTMDGIKYSSKGRSLPTNTANEFFFNSDGSLFGSLSEDSNYINVGALPAGWSATSTVAAPEIDPASAISGFTLLFGGLAVLLGGRRVQNASR